MVRFVSMVGVGAALFAASTLAERVTIVSEDQAAKSWVHAPDQPRAVAGYPTAAADKGRDVCINIGYLIRSDGSTADFTRMKAWSSAGGEEPRLEEVQPFVQLAAATVSTWRFVPAAPKAHPIYTSATFAFDGSQALSVEDIRARCRIADLAGHVQKAKKARNDRGRIYRSRPDHRASDAAAIEPGPPDYH